MRFTAIDTLGRLPLAERGLVLGLALGGVRGVDPLVAVGHVAGSAGAACRAALELLAGLAREERARCLAALARAALDPVPEGIARVHPGWLREALEREATPILLAVVAGLPAEVVAVADEIVEARGEAPALRVPAAIAAGPLAELRRALFASFVPTEERSGEVGPAGWMRFLALPAGALAFEVARGGAETLGLSLQGAPAELIAHAAARLGEAGASVARAAATRAPALPPSERQQARALVAAAASPPPDAEPLGAAEAIGIEVVAHALDGEPDQAARAVAQRLPPALGRTLLRVRDRRR